MIVSGWFSLPALGTAPSVRGYLFGDSQRVLGSGGSHELDSHFYYQSICTCLGNGDCAVYESVYFLITVIAFAKKKKKKKKGKSIILFPSGVFQ